MNTDAYTAKQRADIIELIKGRLVDDVIQLSINNEFAALEQLLDSLIQFDTMTDVDLSQYLDNDDIEQLELTA